MEKKTLKDTENSATCFCSWSGKTFQLIGQVSYRGIPTLSQGPLVFHPMMMTTIQTWFQKYVHSTVILIC